MTLSTFPNETLDANLRRLVHKETLTTIEILKHLAEVERRELHLRLGYSSVWDYATKGLKYSEPAAHRRISAARSLARYPEIEGLLKERKINLSTLSLVSSALSPESFEHVMAKIKERTKREVEAFLSTYRPKARVTERVTPIAIVSKPVVEEATEKANKSITILSPEPKRAPNVEAPNALRAFKVQCVLSESGYKKLKEVESLLSHSKDSIGDVVEALCDYFLQKESPIHRPIRGRTTFPKTDSRYIPRALKKQVWERDKGCCSFIGRNGERCGSTHRLQIDHIQPLAIGGKTEWENLRLLCAAHNRFAAKEVLGRAFMEKAIARSKADACCIS